MRFPRSAGILLHPSSLPGGGGIGSIGEVAHHFVDFLADAGMHIWQVLPLGPTGFGESPYQCLSAFAGNPLLIGTGDDEANFDEHAVDFARVIPRQRERLAAAVDAFRPDAHYHDFVTAHRAWLEDFALFAALKEAHGGVAWTEWEPGAAQRDPAALASWSARLAHAIECIRVEQYLFFSQFQSLRRHCAARGVRLMGDLPIYVAHDSADVWANRSLFRLREDGRPLVQAGVPPDYFSATGQLWGNPLYDWDAMARTGFTWWIDRVRHAVQLFDMVRIDHFRGFESYWEVPGDALTATNGRWVTAPGDALFSAISAALGPLPIVAENLGVITPQVEALRLRYGFPGMLVLQFAFGADRESFALRPHNLERSTVVYTGTHDNDTALGWWNDTGGGGRDPSLRESEREVVRAYLGTDGREIGWTLIRAAFASVCDTAIVPMQDVLGLGSEARMNVPGRLEGNWRFRFAWSQVTPEMVRRLRTLAETYER